MAEGVPYVPGSGTTVMTVGADVVTSAVYQRVKLVVGSDSTVLGDVDLTQPLPVTHVGTIGVSGVVGAVVTGAVSISAMPAVQFSGTQLVSVVPGLSVSAQVAGTVNVSGAVQVSNGASVTIQQGASVSAQVSGTVSISGAVGTVSTIITVLGTAVVSVVPGLSVSAVVSGTVSLAGQPITITATSASPVFVSQINPPAGGGGSVTTAPPSISATGQMMFVVGGQGTTAFPVYVSQINPPAAGGGSVTTAVPSVSATGQVMWIAGGQSTTAFPVVITGTVTAGAGTTVVSLTGSAQVSGTVTAILPGSTTGSSGMSGVLVWLGASQTVIISTQVSGTVSLVNGASVTIQQGVSVSAVVSGTVTAILPGSTTGSSGMSGVLVWLGASQTVLISTQVSGTVSLVNGASVTIQQGASVSAVVSGTVTVANPGATTTAVPSVSAVGQVMWIAGGQSTTAFPVVITGTVTAGAGTTVVSLTGSALVSGTITVLEQNTTTAVPSISATGEVIWLAGGQSTTAFPVFVSQINPPAGGGGSVTTAVPSVSATGQIMWIVGGQSTTAFPVVITGTVTAGAGTTVVSLTGSALVSGTVTVNGSVAVSGTALVSLANVVVTTTATSGVSGPVVWLGVGQTLATVSTIVTILGTQIVSVVPGVSVTIQQGASVSAVVSGTVTAILPGSTTGSSGMSGVLVWLGASQTILISTQVSGTVSLINGASVTIQQGVSVSAQVSGTITLLNTAPVITTAPSISAVGQVMWIAGGQSTTAFPVVITGTVTAGAGTTVVSLTGSAIVSGTISVSGMLITTTGVTTGTAQAVWIMNPTTVTVTIAGTTTGTVSLLSIVPVTTQASVSVSGLPVWFSPGALISISGTALMSQVPGASVTALVSGTVTADLGILDTTTQAGAGGTGVLVWMAASQTVQAQQFPVGTAVAFSYTTAVAPTTLFQPGFILAMDLTTVAATTRYTVPAGKVFVLRAIQCRIQNTAASIGIGRAEVYVLASTAAFTTAAPILAAGFVANNTSATNAGNINGAQFGAGIVFPAGATIGVNMLVTGASSMPFAFIVQGIQIP